MAETNFPPPDPESVVQIATEGDYQYEVKWLRTDIAHYFDEYGSLDATTNWLYFRYKVYEEDGAGDSETRTKETALFMLTSRWPHLPPRIRMITNIQYPSNQSGRWLIEDAMIDSNNNAYFYTGMHDFDDDPTYLYTHAPLFFVVDDKLIISKNARNKTTVEKVTKDEGSVSPFGMSNYFHDRSFAISKLQGLFNEVVALEVDPIAVSGRS